MGSKSFPQLSVELLVFPEGDSGTILLAAEQPWKAPSIFTPEQLRLPLSQGFTGDSESVQDFFSPLTVILVFL